LQRIKLVTSVLIQSLNPSHLLPCESIRWQYSRAVCFRLGACAPLLVITPPLSLLLARPKSQIDSSSCKRVSTFCLDVGGPKPRAERRADGWVCREREFAVFSSVRTVVHFGSSVTTFRFWFQCSYTIGDISVLVPLLLHRTRCCRFCVTVTASDCRKSFLKDVFAY
jgi:hypothetical protein